MPNFNVNDPTFELDLVGELRDHCSYGVLKGTLNPENGEIQLSTHGQLPSTGIPFTIRYYRDEGDDAFEAKFDQSSISNYPNPEEIKTMVQKVTSAINRYEHLRYPAEQKQFTHRLWKMDNYNAQAQAIMTKFNGHDPFGGEQYLLNIASVIHRTLDEATSHTLLSPIIRMISSYLLNPIEDWIRQHGPAEKEQKRLQIKVREDEHQQSLWDMYPSTP